MAENQAALDGLDRLIGETKARLAANPDYIALKALEKARAEITGVKAKAAVTPFPFPVIDYSDQPHLDEGILPAKKVSHLAGAAMALEKAGHPLPIRELTDGAIEAGAFIGGENKLVNLGSSLSKSDKFKSVRWKGDYAWWFSDRPVPSSASLRIRPVQKEAAE